MPSIRIRKFTVRNSRKLTNELVKAVSEVLYEHGVLYKITIGKVYITFITEPISDSEFWPLSKDVKAAKKNVK